MVNHQRPIKTDGISYPPFGNGFKGQARRKLQKFAGRIKTGSLPMQWLKGKSV